MEKERGCIRSGSQGSGHSFSETAPNTPHVLQIQCAMREETSFHITEDEKPIDRE